MDSLKTSPKEIFGFGFFRYPLGVEMNRELGIARRVEFLELRRNLFRWLGSLDPLDHDTIF